MIVYILDNILILIWFLLYFFGVKSSLFTERAYFSTFFLDPTFRAQMCVVGAIHIYHGSPLLEVEHAANQILYRVSIVSVNKTNLI